MAPLAALSAYPYEKARCLFLKSRLTTKTRGSNGWFQVAGCPHAQGEELKLGTLRRVIIVNFLFRFSFFLSFSFFLFHH